MMGAQGLRRHEAESSRRGRRCDSVGLRSGAGMAGRLVRRPAAAGGPCPGPCRHAAAALLDEPLGALDALTRIEMQRLIERLWSDRRFTALLVTHDVSEAVALADRVILIERGKVALDLPTALARPRVKDTGFAHFEKRILDRVLEPDDRAGAQKEMVYLI